MKKINYLLVLLVSIIIVGCDTGKNETIYKIGDYYDVDGIKGVVYKVAPDGLSGMIVSLEEASLQWSDDDNYTKETGATDLDSGKNNMATILNNFVLEDYPAFKFVNDMNDNAAITGWFLPAKNELIDLYNSASEIQFTLDSLGATPLTLTVENSSYWSSSESAPAKAWNIKFGTGESFSGVAKMFPMRVRGVHTF